MGLLLAGVGSVKGVLADTWREYFYCEALDETVLVAKGRKRRSKHSSNNGDDNIITDGSIIAVNEGQCVLIVEQGQIIDFCAEPGEYVYDYSSEPSILMGNLWDSVKATYEQAKKRFAFGGNPGKDQRIYYFNTKEIYGNRYGTPNPIPFRVVDQNIGLDIDISIRCNGEYSYKIVDPILFYKNVCGNVSYVFERSEIDSTLKTELLTALQPAFSLISEKGIRYSSLPGHTLEIAEALNQVLSKQWSEKRGIVVSSFGINSITASKEDEEMLKQLQKSAALRNTQMAAATLVEAQADAMKSAAKNPNGAMTGFMGVNMASQAGGFQASELYSMNNETTNPNSWTCSCGTVNTGKFCSECGKPKSSSSYCPECGAKLEGNPKFCPECGKKL